MTLGGVPCSAGCMLVDRDNWNTFIGLFNTKTQKDNIVGITISRTHKKPVISKYETPKKIVYPSIFIYKQDNTVIPPAIEPIIKEE